MGAPHYWIWKITTWLQEQTGETYVMSRHGDLLDAAADIREATPPAADVIRAERVARGPLIDHEADARFRAEVETARTGCGLEPGPRPPHEWGTTQSSGR